MKVLQTIGGFGAKGGGTSTCTYELLSAIHQLGTGEEIDLLTPNVVDSSDQMLGQGEEWIKVVPNDYKTPLSISRNMADYLEHSDYDIYHTNGMWMYINHETCRMARRKGKPYIITPHGMLYPEALSRSAWKKKLIRKWWFDKDIRHAACIHVTCEDEMRHVRTLGYQGAIALIGNPVSIPAYTEDLFDACCGKTSPFGGIAFLGRLHPIKRVENLLYGVALSSKDIDIYIIGKGDAEYERFLQTESHRLGISKKVYFLGFLNGRDKFEQLAKIDALFVPSDMENFGMIIPEALIVGTPVMASLGTPWKALNDERCGWWTDNTAESIAKVIDEIYACPQSELTEMGRRGRNYILRTFAADQIARKMLRLYKWILNGGNKPEFIYE